MFCQNCGTQNNDAYTNCVNCGAPLREPQYSQPQQYQQQSQQPYYGYAEAPVNAVNGSKPTVLYIVAGIMAVISFALVFAPSFFYGTIPYNPFSLVVDSYRMTFASSGSGSMKSVLDEASLFIIVMFVIPMGFQIAWAILSFAQKRPAGIFGIISSVIYLLSSFIWSLIVAVADSSPSVAVLPVPLFMILMAIAGIPVSIIQLVKRKYL